MINKRIAYSLLSDWKFKVIKAQGSFLWTHYGKKLIDFASGWNVTNLGWNHPEVNAAIIQQVKRNVYVPIWTSEEIQEEYAHKLTSCFPKELNTVIRTTGGTEANEVAIKLSRAATGRKKIIGFKDTYHGQLFATMALGFRPKYIREIGPVVPNFIQLDYPYSQNVKNSSSILKNFLEALEKKLSRRDVAAILTEPEMITGWGSCGIAPKGFLKGIRKLTRKYGTLMIIDEVGTGFSRLGKLFAIEYSGITPDIVTLAKASTNGAGSIGTVISSSELIKDTIPEANYTSTFGWTPLSCAAALKTLEIHKRDKTWLLAEKKGKYLLKVLQTNLRNYGNIVSVHGIGMEVGVRLENIGNHKNEEIVPEIVNKCHNNGLHIVDSSEGNIQLMPPLIIKQETLDQAINILVTSIADIISEKG